MDAVNDITERLRAYAELADQQGNRLDAAGWRATADRIDRLRSSTPETHTPLSAEEAEARRVQALRFLAAYERNTP